MSKTKKTVDLLTPPPTPFLPIPLSLHQATLGLRVFELDLFSIFGYLIPVRNYYSLFDNGMAVENDILLVPFDEVDNSYIKLDIAPDGSQYFLLELYDTGLSVPGLLSQRADLSIFRRLLSRAPAALLVAENIEGLNMTVFAPTDAAFAALQDVAPAFVDFLLSDQVNTTLLETLLLHHMVVGQKLSTYEMANGTVTAADGSAIGVHVQNFDDVTLNGITHVVANLANLAVAQAAVHGIDAILFPPDFARPTHPSTVLGALEAAAFASNYSLLPRLAREQQLNGTLVGPGPFTLLAFPGDSLAEGADAARTVAAHVLLGKVDFSTLSNGTSLPTLLDGKNLTFVRTDDTLALVDFETLATVVLTDEPLFADNGRVYRISDAFFVAAPSEPTPAPTTLAAFLANNVRYSILWRLVLSSGIDTAAFGNANTTATLFLPDDAAFSRMFPGELDALLAADAEEQQRFLGYHLVLQALPSSLAPRAPDAALVNSSNGLPLQLQLRDGAVYVGGDVAVVEADIAVGDSLVHILRRPLTPPPPPTTPSPLPNLMDALRLANFTTLVQLLELTGLDGTLSVEGPLTLLAPSDAAFAKLDDSTVAFLLSAAGRQQLRSALLYHTFGARLDTARLTDGTEYLSLYSNTRVRYTVENNVSMFDGAAVVRADGPASNGVYHELDSVLVPDFVDTVADVVSLEGGLSTLASLIAADADIQAQLNGIGEFTLFAPSDAVFEAASVDTMTWDAATRKAVLLAHTVAGTLSAEALLGGSSVTTLAGTVLPVNRTNSTTTVGGVPIGETPLEASNGAVFFLGGILPTAAPSTMTQTTMVCDLGCDLGCDLVGVVACVAGGVLCARSTSSAPHSRSFLSRLFFPQNKLQCTSDDVAGSDDIQRDHDASVVKHKRWRRNAGPFFIHDSRWECDGCLDLLVARRNDDGGERIHGRAHAAQYRRGHCLGGHPEHARGQAEGG